MKRIPMRWCVYRGKIRRAEKARIGWQIIRCSIFTFAIAGTHWIVNTPNLWILVGGLTQITYGGFLVFTKED